MIDRDHLHHNGYALLRGAVPPDWLAPLRQAFDTGYLPSEQWPAPRGHDWRHSQLDHDPTVQALCRLPALLPVAGGGHQRLHRDLSCVRPGDSVTALVYLDDYGPANGATRIVPASHRPKPGEPAYDFANESGAVQLNGRAGDVLVFDVDLVHAGSLNIDGGRRRTLLIGYFAEGLHEMHQRTANLRGVRMDTQERFEPV